MGQHLLLNDTVLSKRKKLHGTLLASAALLAGTFCGLGALAAPVTVDLTSAPALDGSQGTGAVAINANLSLAGITSITTLPFSGNEGAVYIGAEGAGVRDYGIIDDQKGAVSSPSGANGISGGGDALEALVLLFTTPVIKTSLQIGLNEYQLFTCEAKVGQSCGYRDDELTLILEDSLGNQATLSAALLESLFPSGPRGFDDPIVDLSNAALSASIAGLIDIKSAWLRSDPNGYFFVSSVGYDVSINAEDVPESGGLGLLGLGLIGLGAAMRRRRLI